MQVGARAVTTVAAVCVCVYVCVCVCVAANVPYSLAVVAHNMDEINKR